MAQTQISPKQAYQRIIAKDAADSLSDRSQSARLGIHFLKTIPALAGSGTFDKLQKIKAAESSEEDTAKVQQDKEFYLAKMSNLKQDMRQKQTQLRMSCEKLKMRELMKMEMRYELEEMMCMYIHLLTKIFILILVYNYIISIYIRYFKLLKIILSVI